MSDKKVKGLVGMPFGGFKVLLCPDLPPDTMFVGKEVYECFRLGDDYARVKKFEAEVMIKNIGLDDIDKK